MKANAALVFRIGEVIEVKTKRGQLLAGRVSMRAPDCILLVSDEGQMRVATGAILSVCRPDLLPGWAR